MHITIKKDSIKKNIAICLIVLILFINASLYTIDTIDMFIKAIIVLVIISWLFLLIHIGAIKKFFKTKYFLWLSLLFILYECYGFTRIVYGNFNWDYLLALYVSVVTICTLFTSIPDSYKINSLYKICIFASLAICSYILINEYTNIIGGGVRIGESGSGNVNTIGTYLSVFSIPIMYGIIIKKQYNQIPVFLVQLIFMFLTGSKKTLLLIVLGLFIYYTYKNGFKLHKYIKLLLIVFLIFFMIIKIDFFYNIIGFRVVDFFGELGLNIGGSGFSYSTEQRMQMYKIAPTLFLQHPIIGGGWGYFAAFSGLKVYSHSNIIELLITFGLLGFIIYYSMYINLLKKAIKQVQKKEGIIVFCFLVLLIVNDAFTITFCQVPICYFSLFVSYVLIEFRLELSDREKSGIVSQ